MNAPRRDALPIHHVLVLVLAVGSQIAHAHSYEYALQCRALLPPIAATLVTT
jgi:hypothetical protein